MRPAMHPELQEAIDLHDAIVSEAGKALIGDVVERHPDSHSRRGQND